MGKTPETRPMSATHPRLSKEFRYVVGQPDRTIHNTVAGTNLRIHYECSDCAHHWKTTGNARCGKIGSGCPACSGRVVKPDGSNSMERVEHASEFRYVVEKPAATLQNTVAGTNAKVGWCCSECLYPWEATGADRLSGKGCSACGGQQVKPDGSNSIAASSYGKSFLRVPGEPWRTADNTVAGFASAVEWRCPECSYIWAATGNTRAQGCGCNACAGKVIKPDGSNSIEAASHGKEFRYLVGNPTATAANTVAGTAFRAGWECSECSNVWEASGTNREHGGTGCPKCNRIYSVSEHISNTYLKILIRDTTLSIDAEPGAVSRVPNSKGRPFQVDARIHSTVGLIAYLYDGLRGHRDEKESRKTDTLRRQKLCLNVAFVVAHRHGMSGLEKEIGAANYVEVLTEVKSSVFAGTVQVIQTLNTDLNIAQVDFESVFETARVSWNAMPKANSLKFESVLKREKKALILEGYLPDPKLNQAGT